MNCQILSEIEPIETVIIHNPGNEHNWVTPDNIRPFHQMNGEIVENSDYLLFDDILDIDYSRNHFKQNIFLPKLLFNKVYYFSFSIFYIDPHLYFKILTVLLSIMGSIMVLRAKS